MTTTLNVTLVIAGTDYSAYVDNARRSAQLDTPGATAQIYMKATFPHTDVNPYDDLALSEQGTLVLTGYLTHIIPNRASGQVGVELDATDTFKRCQDWFIDNNFYTGGPDAQLTDDLTAHNVGYYVGYLCNLCGISYSINDTSGSSITLASDVPLGLRSVSESLTTLCAVGQWVMRVDPGGILQFDHVNRPSTADHILSAVEQFEQDVNDTDTRNQVKIWGFQSLDGGEILYQESRVVAGVSGTRTMVFAEPHVDTVAKAQQLASAALDQWARLENVLSLSTVGNPAIRVGETVQYSHDKITSGSYLDIVTDLRSILGEGGYQQEITAGRRAYRYPYWPLSRTPPQEWDQADYYGEVYDTVLYGNFVYSAGWSYFNNQPGQRRCWHVECRALEDGALVWQRTMDVTTVHSAFSNGSGNAINGLSIANGIVFLCGTAILDGLSTRTTWRVEALNSVSGITYWSQVYAYDPYVSTSGLDVVANSSSVTFLGTFPYNIPNPTTGGVLTIGVYAPSFCIGAASTAAAPGLVIAPLEDETAFDGAVFHVPLARLNQIYLDPNGGFISGGEYNYYYGKQIVPVYWPPPIAYYFTAQRPWFGKFDSGGNIVWSVKHAYVVSDVNYGVDHTNAISPIEDRQYRISGDSFLGETGGLGKYNMAAAEYQVNIGHNDRHGHVEIGKYIFNTNGVALQWRQENDGSLVSSRTATGVSALHGIALITTTDQMAVGGIKAGLFWTAVWDQPT